MYIDFSRHRLGHNQTVGASIPDWGLGTARARLAIFETKLSLKNGQSRRRCAQASVRYRAQGLEREQFLKTRHFHFFNFHSQ